MAVSEAHELEVEVEKDVVFGRGGSRDLLCDVYRPAPARTKHTAVIHLHGGGFRVGSKAGTRLARPLAALGYTSVSSSYRLVDAATWPAQMEDVQSAIRWVRDNAGQLDIEASKVVVLGYSAGGRLALLAGGLEDQPVAASVALYAPVGSGRANQNGGAHPVLGGNPSPELIRSFNPLQQVKAGFVPTLLLHGTADETVPVEDSLTFYSALREVGTAVELHLIDGVTHIFDMHEDLALASAQWIDLFLDRHVVNPRTYPSTEPRR